MSSTDLSTYTTPVIDFDKEDLTEEQLQAPETILRNPRLGFRPGVAFNYPNLLAIYLPWGKAAWNKTATPPAPLIKIRTGLPLALYHKLISFFEAVHQKHDSEVVVYVWKTDDGVDITVPRQKVSGASAKVDDKTLTPPVPNALLIGHIHSHNRMEAFFSGTDDSSETQDGLFFGVIGKLHTGHPVSKWRVRVAGGYVDLLMENIVEAPAPTPQDVPQEWLDAVSRYTVVHRAGQGAGGTFRTYDRRSGKMVERRWVPGHGYVYDGDDDDDNTDDIIAMRRSGHYLFTDDDDDTTTADAKDALNADTPPLRAHDQQSTALVKRDDGIQFESGGKHYLLVDPAVFTKRARKALMFKLMPWLTPELQSRSNAYIRFVDADLKHVYRLYCNGKMELQAQTYDQLTKQEHYGLRYVLGGIPETPQ